MMKNSLPAEEQKKIINRLRRTEGQIRGVQKMMTEEQECIDIITQLNAIRSSIDRVMGIVVAENLKSCLEYPETNPQDQTEKLQQAINMIIKK